MVDSVESPPNAVEKELETLFPKDKLDGSAGNDLMEDRRQALFNTHQGLCHEALALMRVKNRDYGANEDPFRNFHKHGALGIMVRLDDKIARLESFMEKGFNAVKSESVRDTIIDGINYLVLLYAYMESRGMLDED